MIDWNKYFDHIYCIHYIPHKNRFNGLQSELSRIGILDSKIFSYYYTNKESFNNVSTVSQKHIEVYNDALKNNYNRILVLENDIRFYNDIDIIKTYLDNIPQEYDLLLLDYIYGYYKDELDRIINKRKENFNTYWININKDSNVWSCGCYALSQKMMKHIIDNQNNKEYLNKNNIYGPDYFTTYKSNSIDQEIDKSLLRFVPYYNLAIQKTYFNNLRIKLRGTDNSYYRYNTQNINIHDYNIMI